MDQDISLSVAEQVTTAKPAGYEFTPVQNSTIQGLGDRMKAIGVLHFALGGLMAIGGILFLFSSLVSAFLHFVLAALFGLIGRWMYSGADSFLLIVRTRGSDIQHLMHALEDLRRFYNFMYWSIVVVLGLIALGVIFMIVTVLA